MMVVEEDVDQIRVDQRLFTLQCCAGAVLARSFIVSQRHT